MKSKVLLPYFIFSFSLGFVFYSYAGLKDLTKYKAFGLALANISKSIAKLEKCADQNKESLLEIFALREELFSLKEKFLSFYLADDQRLNRMSKRLNAVEELILGKPLKNFLVTLKSTLDFAIKLQNIERGDCHEQQLDKEGFRRAMLWNLKILKDKRATIDYQRLLDLAYDTISDFLGIINDLKNCFNEKERVLIDESISCFFS